MPYQMTINGRELPLNQDEQSCACKLHAFGCVFCLCTLCLSWIPLCCYCSKMDKKYASPQRVTEEDADAHNKNAGASPTPAPGHVLPSTAR